MSDLNWLINEGEKNVVAADLMTEALYRLLISSFDELVKDSGNVKALTTVKTYRKWGAPLLMNELKKRLTIQSNGPDAMLLAHAFTGYLFGVQPDLIGGEIKEKGAVGTFQGCPFAGVGSPDLCLSISHFGSEFEAEMINPEYECVWTHHESIGDPYCRYVFKKKSDPIFVLDDLGKTLAVLPRFEVPEELLRPTRIWLSAGTLYSNICAFLDLNGEEKSEDAIGGLAKRIGQEMGARVAKENLQWTESTESVGKLVRAMQNALGQRDNFVIVSESEVANEITDCSWSVFPSHTDVMCKTFESFFKGMVSGINPDFELAYDRMITKGDKDCRWTIKGRPSSNKISEPLKVLKMRLAEGEISEEEYKRLKQLLEE